MNNGADSSSGVDIPDAHERREALDPQRSFIVKAPAGSGKTSLLVCRFLTLLAGAARPEEVLAITFTRKATAEMRARVLDALGTASGPAPQAAHERHLYELARAVAKRDAEMDWNLSANPQRLRIHTIDALCGSLARQLPVMSGLGGGLHTLDDATVLFESTARRTLALIGDREVGGPVARVLAHVDGNMASFEKLVAQMLACREQWVRYLARDDDAARDALEAQMRAIVSAGIKSADRALPDEQRAQLLTLARFAADRAQSLEIESGLRECLDLECFPSAECETLSTWKALAHLLLTGQGSLRKRVLAKIFVKKDTPDEYAAMQSVLAQLADNEPLARALDAIRALPAPRYDEQQWQTLQDLFAVLKLAMAMLRIEFADAGSCDFTEQVLAASQALGDEQSPTDLTLALEHRIVHLLVDEFQDTSAAHFAIVQKLTGGWAPSDGHTLFVVGDPMQSIYRFREAEVGLFLACYAQGLQAQGVDDAQAPGVEFSGDELQTHALRDIALQPIALRANFRSREGVVEWVNEHFASILPARDDAVRAAAAFERSQAIRGAGDSPAVAFHGARGESVEQQAQRVAQCVADTRAAHPERGIAILLRARSHARAIVDALAARGLSWRGLDLQPLFGVPAVRDLHALTCAALHPLDRASWLAVLRAPWCGLTLDDLEALVGDSSSKAVVQLLDDAIIARRLSADGRERLARVAPVLRELLARRGEDRLAALIRRAWRALGGPACLDGASIDDPRRYLELLAATERDTGLGDGDELARRVGQLYASPRVGAVDVEIMTIHRAKGLEFDVVLLPALERLPRGDSPSMLAWSRVASSAGDGMLLAPLPPPEGEDDSPIHRFVRGIEADKRRLETARLLYVACTRAREQMHLFANVRWNDKTDEPANPVSDSLLAWLWPAVGAQCAALPAGDEVQAASHAGEALSSSQATIARLPISYRVDGVPSAVERAGAIDPAAVDGQAVEFSWAGRSARLVGIVAHNVLRQISESGTTSWDAQRLSHSAVQWRTQLHELGLEGAALDEATQAVIDSLTNTLHDSRGQWLLDAAHEDSRSEYPLSGVLDGAVVNAVLDRTFVDDKGVRWIVDYKTGAHRGGALDEFLDREQQRYEPQLHRYAQLVRALDQRPIRLALYFPAIGAWREWAWAGESR